MQARPIIEALRRARPNVQIAYSFFSPSAESFANSLNVDMADYLPFDNEGDASKLIDALAPTALCFVKLDVWPKLVAVAKRKRVVVGLLSGTVAPKSGRQGVMSRSILRDAYAALDIVGAIDATNGERLLGLGVIAERLSVSGDTRFDQVWSRAQNVNRDSTLLRALHSARPTVVAGSTWPADEAVLLPAWMDVKARVPNARLIIAPHEPTPEHINPIEGWARANALSCERLSAREARDRGNHGDYVNDGHDGNCVDGGSDGNISNTSNTNDIYHISFINDRSDTDVVIVDRVGVLGDIYAIAHVAFVGGAFHKAGLHSVLEPAAYGVPVVFGPGHSMSREAGLLLQAGGARTVSTRAECATAMSEWLTNSDAHVRAGALAKAFVESELGAAERSLQLVLSAL